MVNLASCHYSFPFEQRRQLFDSTEDDKPLKNSNKLDIDRYGLNLH